MTGFTLFRIGSVEVRFCDGWSEITIPTLPMFSIPWTEKPEDRALAERLGYDDPVLMNRDHDVVHLLIAHWLGRGVAPALSYAAGLRPAHPGWRLEEDAVLSMQAWMQASGTSLEELLRPYRMAETAAPIGVGGAAPRAPSDVDDDLFGKAPLVVRPLSATKGADWALCLDVPGEIVIAVSPGVAGFTRYVERDRRRFEALADSMTNAHIWERACKLSWETSAEKDHVIERLQAEVDRGLYGLYYADFQAARLRYPDDGIRSCTGLDLDALAAAKRLRALGLVTIEDSPAGPMVAWVPGRGRSLDGMLHRTEGQTL